jgi:hypothetical protein
MNKINSTYGDELLKEKGGIPHDYRSCLCYRYPWVPFRLTINRDEKEKTEKKDADREVRYKIFDGARDALVAEGEVVDDKIEDLFPDIEDPAIFIDGERIWLRPELPERPLENAEGEDDGRPMIKDMYWTYGKDHIKLDSEPSRYYADLNYHVETENYDDGDMVEVTLRRGDELPLFGETYELKLIGTVSNNNVVFENVFNGHTLNIY